MIREMAGVERTQHITKVVKKFKDQFFELSKRYHSGVDIEDKNEFSQKFFG